MQEAAELKSRLGNQRNGAGEGKAMSGRSVGSLNHEVKTTQLKAASRAHVYRWGLQLLQDQAMDNIIDKIGKRFLKLTKEDDELPKK